MRIALSFLFFCSLCVSTLTAQVPEVDWLYTFGGKGFDMIWKSEMDGQGNIINVGVFSDTVDFDHGAGTTLGVLDTGKRGAFVQKLDPSGNLLWVKTFSPADKVTWNTLAVAPDGSIYMAGGFQSDSLDCDPDPNQTAYVYKGTYSQATYIIKLDGQGNHIWSLAQGGEVLAEALKLDTLGNLYVTGNFDGTFDRNPDPGIHNPINPYTAGKSDFYIQKIDSAGNQLWLEVVRGVDDVFSSDIDLTIFQEPVIVGQFKKAVDFDPGPGYATISPVRVEFKGFILSLDTAGNYKSVWHTAGAGSGNYIDILIDDNNDIYIAGAYDGYADLDPSSGIANPRTGTSMGWFIQRLNADGTLNWLHPYETSYSYIQRKPFRLTVDKFKNVLLAGYYDFALNLEPVNPNGLTLNGSYHDIFIAKHDSSGAVRWAQSFGGSQRDRALTVMSNDFENIYISGYFSSTVNFDPYSPNLSRTSEGDYDCYVLKFKACAPSQDTTIPIAACNFYKTPSGQRFYSDTLIVDTLASVLGCDSVVKRDIQIIQLASIYEGLGSLHWNISTTDSVTFRWLDCNTQTLIPGQSGPDLMITQNGSYALIVSDGNCTDTSACLTIDNIGLGELNNTEAISVYPNPVDDILWIAGSEDKVYNLTLYNMIGRKLRLVSEQNHMDLSSLPAGTYFLQIEREGRSMVKKVVHR